MVETVALLDDIKEAILGFTIPIIEFPNVAGATVWDKTKTAGVGVLNGVKTGAMGAYDGF